MNANAASPAWAYLVVSSEQQAETLDHQDAWAKDVAASNGWSITKKFRGVSSGRDGTRGLLEELLEELRRTARADRPQRVLMIRLDRIGRGLGFEALAAIAEMSRLGITIHTRQDGDYTLARASDSILPLMRVVTGAIENEARRDKAKAVYSRRRASSSVVGNKRPYGLALENGRDVPQNPQAQVVQLAFELAQNGYGLSAIGSRLNAIAPPKLYVNGRQHQTEWTNARVSRLLKNPAYCTTLISERTWLVVQSLRTSSYRERAISKNPWPLSGAIHCSCGRILIGSIHGSPPRRVYRCSAKTIHGKIVTHGAKLLESAFEELLSRLASTPELESAYAVRSQSTVTEETFGLREYEIQNGTKTQLAERQRAWNLNENGLITDVELARRLAEVDAKLKAYEIDLASLESQKRALEIRRENLLRADVLVQDAAVLWRDGEVDARRYAAQSLSRAVGGLYVQDGALRIGDPPQSDRFIRAKHVSSAG